MILMDRLNIFIKPKICWLCLWALFFLPILSCSVTAPLEQASWLIGTWKRNTSKGIVYERWIQKSADEFYGLSYSIKENDTIIFETISIVQDNDRLTYIPRVPDQNEGRPIHFHQSIINNREMVFENPDHDFPQRISYTLIKQDSLIAVVSGEQHGTITERSFPMKRMK